MRLDGIGALILGIGAATTPWALDKAGIEVSEGVAFVVLGVAFGLCADGVMFIAWPDGFSWLRQARHATDDHPPAQKVEVEQTPSMRWGSNRGVRPLSPGDKRPLKLEVRSDPSFIPRMPDGGDHYWVVSGLRVTNRETKPVVLHFTLHIPWPDGGPGIPSEPMNACSAIIHPAQTDRDGHWSHSIEIPVKGSAAGHLDFYFAKSFVDSLKTEPMTYHDAFAVPKEKFLEIRDDLSGRACAHDFV